MRSEPARRVLGTSLALMVLCAGGLRAGEPPSDRMLEERGLKRAGPLLILLDEAAVHSKADEVRGLQHDYMQAVARRRSTLSEKEYQDTIRELNAELNQLKAQSNSVTAAMNRMPRRRGYPANTEEYQELTYVRNQLQMQISQGTAFLNQIKSQPFDPKARLKADVEAQDKQQALNQGALGLRTLVDEVRQKYAAISKNPDVKRWLDTPEGHAAVKPKLGPSHTFKMDEKLLERIERETGSADPFAPAHKATRKGRRTTRAKHATQSKDVGNSF
jgi:hypothetical protein